MKNYWIFIRPFTLLVPAFGMLSGALMALGASPKWHSHWNASGDAILSSIMAGIVMAAALNAYSNGVNQIYDLELDRINKPHRLLPAGRMSVREAATLSSFFLMLALLLAFWINWQCGLIASAAALLTFVYSAPPLRTKCRGIWANITIAIPRGTLLVVAGWSTVKPVNDLEPWVIGVIFGLYFLGAVTTKDFSDLKGDRDANCKTLPLIYGVQRSVRIISPFLIVPFLAILPAVYGGLLEGHRLALSLLGILLSGWGAYIVWRLVRSPEESLICAPGEGSENHPTWKHMYLLTLVAQLGFSGAYLLRGVV